MVDEIQGGGISGVPKLTAANAAEDARLAPIPTSPTGIAVLGQTVVRIAVVAQALSTAVGGIFALFLPQPWAVTGCAVCAGVFAVAGVVTGVGPGVRKLEKDVTPVR